MLTNTGLLWTRPNTGRCHVHIGLEAELSVHLRVVTVARAVRVSMVVSLVSLVNELSRVVTAMLTLHFVCRYTSLTSTSRARSRQSRRADGVRPCSVPHAACLLARRFQESETLSPGGTGTVVDTGEKRGWQGWRCRCLPSSRAVPGAGVCLQAELCGAVIPAGGVAAAGFALHHNVVPF